MNVVYNVTANRLGASPLDKLIEAGQQALSNLAQQQIEKNIDRVIFYSAYSAPVMFTGAEIAKQVPSSREPPQGRISKSLIERAKPTLVVSGSFGTKTFAPYGVADPNEFKSNVTKLWVGSVALLALFAVGGYYLGIQKGKRLR